MADERAKQADLVNASGVPFGDPIVAEAHAFFIRVAERESDTRKLFVDDLKFSHGDADNGYQWPSNIRQERDADQRPCLTINMIAQHNNMIVNDAKKNKSSIAVKPTGNGATKESSDVVAALIRHVEYQSDAQDAYSTALEFQVDGGVGYWRLVTRYVDNTSHDQEIYIERVPDPLSVYMDPDCQNKDCSDAKRALVFDYLTKAEFKEMYPKHEALISLAPLGAGTTIDTFFGKDKVLLCEYFRMVPKEDELWEWQDATGTTKTAKKSDLHESMHESVVDAPNFRKRSIVDQICEWKLIAGEHIIAETVWPGKYIPLIRVIGTETVIDGKLDRKGHTRAMKDPQRMYNYNASAQIEFVALQTKTPWTGSEDAIEGYEVNWNQANRSNSSFLPFKHIGDDGLPIPVQALPQRVQPPVASQAYEQGMAAASMQMMSSSGQYQNQLGMMGNERTGAAIEKRQHQSDTAVFHFQDNFASALRFTGKQLIDLFPKIYDTRRIIMVLARDGTEMAIEIDPTQRQAYLQERGHDAEVVKRVLNPNLGKYDIEAGVGPAYGTQQEQTVESLTLLLTQAPAMTPLIGDLLMGAMNFPEALEAAQRLKRMIPPQALGTGPSPTEQQLQTRVQQLTTLLAKVLQETGKDKLKLIGKGEMRDIDVFEAETKRLDVGAKHHLGIAQLGIDLHGVNLEAIGRANELEVGNEEGTGTSPSPAPASAPAPETPPVAGSRKAPDGQWYLPDPTRAGKYLRVHANA